MTIGLVGQDQITTFTSPVNGTSPIDANVVRGQDNTLKTAFNVHDNDPSIHFQSSLAVARPPAGIPGRKWLDSDTYRVYYDDGASWHEINYLGTAGGSTSGPITVNGGLTVHGPVQLDGVPVIIGVDPGGTQMLRVGGDVHASGPVQFDSTLAVLGVITMGVPTSSTFDIVWSLAAGGVLQTYATKPLGLNPAGNPVLLGPDPGGGEPYRVGGAMRIGGSVSINSGQSLNVTAVAGNFAPNLDLYLQPGSPTGRVVIRSSTATELVQITNAGAVSIGGTLTVLGAVGLTGPVTLGGTLAVSGAAVFGAGLQVTGSGIGIVPGAVYKGTATGLTLIAATGTADDFSVYSPTGVNLLLRTPTGTANLVTGGTLTVPGAVAIGTNAAPNLSFVNGTAYAAWAFQNAGVNKWFAGRAPGTGVGDNFEIHNVAAGVMALTINSVSSAITVPGALTTGSITSTANGVVLLKSAASTLYQYIEIANTGGDILVGVEGNSTAIMAGVTPYDAVIRAGPGTGVSIGNTSLGTIMRVGPSYATVNSALVVASTIALGGGPATTFDVVYATSGGVLQTYASKPLTFNPGGNSVVIGASGVGSPFIAWGTVTLPAYGAGGGLVTAGAADSGGAGFRVLRVPN